MTSDLPWLAEQTYLRRFPAELRLRQLRVSAMPKHLSPWLDDYARRNRSSFGP